MCDTVRTRTRSGDNPEMSVDYDTSSSLDYFFGQHLSVSASTVIEFSCAVAARMVALRFVLQNVSPMGTRLAQ